MRTHMADPACSGLCRRNTKEPRCYRRHPRKPTPFPMNASNSFADEVPARVGDTREGGNFSPVEDDVVAHAVGALKGAPLSANPSCEASVVAATISKAHCVRTQPV